jgi:beta-mannanase
MKGRETVVMRGVDLFRRFVPYSLTIVLLVTLLSTNACAADPANTASGTGTVDPIPPPRGIPAPAAATLTAPAPVPSPTSRSTPPSLVTVTPSPMPPVARNGSIAVGIYPSGMEWDPVPSLDRYIQTVGSSPAVVMFYEDWATDWMRVFPAATMDAAYARGAMPMMTWEPWDSLSALPNQPAYSLGTILSGTYDPWLRGYARDAAAYGKPFYVRLAHEMNGDWVPWGVGVNGNTPAQYIQFWRHVHDIFVSEGAANVRWVWNPSTETDSVPYSSLYPGDAYVDWLGVDGYNGGTGLDWGGWLTVQQIFARSYESLQGLSAFKPMMIGETASTEVGGSKAAWIADLATIIPTRFPQVHALVWFDANKELDWRVASSNSSLAAWRTLIASDPYRGRLP